MFLPMLNSSLQAEERGRPKSKAELAEEERMKREEALSKSLLDDPSSKGFRMMKAMGFKTGEGLGKAKLTTISTPTHITDSVQDTSKPTTPIKAFEPIKPVIKETRSGIGHDTERKRKIMEELQADEPTHFAKRQALSPEDYREQLRLESMVKRQEAQFHAAQKICERFASGDDDNDVGGVDTTTKSKPKTTDPTFSQIKATPILWRGLLHHRAIRALDARMRHDLLQSGPLVGNGSGARLPGYIDPDMEDHDKIAVGNEEVALEEEWEDEELNEFEQRDVKERLDEIVGYLRERWRYCFWCKHRYESEEDLKNGCPGLEEEDHD